MRTPSFFSSCLGIALAACTTTAPTSQPGIAGQALRGTLEVHVAGELDARPIAGASVDVGGAVVTTDANGDATLTTSTSSVTLRVSAPGFTTEEWIGVDRDHARVELVPPLAPRVLTGTLSGGSGDMIVSAETALRMLRTSSPLGSTSACSGGACEVALTVEVRGSLVDVALADGTVVRRASAPIDASDRFAVDVASLASSARLETLSVTVPSAPGLEAVVGVPGVATSEGVTLFPAPGATSVTTSAPALEGPLAGGRLWYVAHAANADGSGVSMIFDRDVGADHVVHFTSAFLAIPVATASGSVGIDVDPEVELYVIEAFAGDAATRTLVLRPSGAHIDVPISLTGASRVVVRAVDTVRQPDSIGLTAAEAYATGIATLEL